MPAVPKLDALAIAAHPDDIEITCGGLLLNLARKGKATGALDLTRGEAGTQGTDTTRLAEATLAAKELQLAWRDNLQLEDAALEATKENKHKLAAAIRATKPDLVILPHWEQRHPDHRVAMQLGYDACFLAGLKKLPIPGEPHRPRKIIFASYFRNTDYSFLVDISEVFEQKCRAVAAYESQFVDSVSYADFVSGRKTIQDLIDSGVKNIFAPGINVFDLMFTRGRYLGQLAQVRFAEAYTIREQILIDDPLTMPVRSI